MGLTVMHSRGYFLLFGVLSFVDFVNKLGTYVQ